MATAAPLPEIDPESIPRRVPALEELGRSEILSTAEKMERAWMAVTEKIRRELLAHNSQVRDTLMHYSTEPVSEDLPGRFLHELSEVGSIARGTRDDLRKFLALPSVPDEHIQPDLRNARTLKTPRENISFLKNYKNPQEELQRRIDSGMFKTGVTEAEKMLIAKRFRFARDVKMLSLGAEILDLQHRGAPVTTTGETKLPSGITLYLDPSRTEESAVLLNPIKWESRKQLKDRVYEVKIAGKKYILKERKTARHWDTKKNGHIPGQTSRKEFETAKFFHERCKKDEGGIAVRWEKPIGYAEFPDGFQFVLFEWEEGLKMSMGKSKLVKNIQDHASDFQEEYKRIAARAPALANDERVTRFANMDQERIHPMKELWKWLRGKIVGKAKAQQLTFEEFSFVRAERMIERAPELLSETIAENSYDNSDLDGYAYRSPKGDKPEVEIIGFDFEYYKKEDAPIDLTEFRKGRQRHLMLTGTDYWDGSANKKITPLQRAAYLALAEEEMARAEEKNKPSDPTS